MTFLSIYARLYRDCAVKAAQGIAKNAWTLLLPMLLYALLLLLAPQVALLGFLGGLALSLLLDALLSCYLYFVGGVVARSKVTLADLKQSVVTYFVSVMSLLFVFWISDYALSFLLTGNRQGGLLRAAGWLVMLVLLNAAPEVIYTRGTRSGVDTITQSVKFIQLNWIEWFVPNLILLGALYLLNQATEDRLGTVGRLGVGLVMGALFHAVMVFRGNLFAALDGSSHRQRMFKFRNQ